jgi:4-hydroxy-4-methyl-2-oxoglutarate aldolase
MPYDPQIVRAFAELGAATAHEAAGKIGAVDPAIRQIVPGTVVCGAALPVCCHVGDNFGLHQAIARATAGDVIVADCGAAPWGYWGDLMSLAAKVRGIAGAVIDGGVRDTAEIAKRGLPVWARHVSVRGTVKRTPGRVGEPVVCGGVVVHRDDLVVADQDGVVVIPAARVTEVLSLARQRQSHEVDFARKLEAGLTTLELLGLTDPPRHSGA